MCDLVSVVREVIQLERLQELRLWEDGIDCPPSYVIRPNSQGPTTHTPSSAPSLILSSQPSTRGEGGLPKVLVSLTITSPSYAQLDAVERARVTIDGMTQVLLAETHRVRQWRYRQTFHDANTPVLSIPPNHQGSTGIK